MRIRSRRRITNNNGHQVTVLDIFMKLYRNVYHIVWLLSIFPFQSFGPLTDFYPYVVLFSTCTPHNTVTGWDILVDYYRNGN